MISIHLYHDSSKYKVMRKLLYASLFLFSLTACKSSVENIDLSGNWTVRLDSADVGINEAWSGQLFDSSILLPGTTDEARLGVRNTLRPALEKPQLLHLTRAYSYIGPAWYAKEITIPSDWEGKDLILHLERVLWDSQVWIDGKKVEGHEESLTTPHMYNLTPYIKAGNKHIMTVRVDNRKRYDLSVNELAHAYTEATQVKWNGILGDMYIEAVNKIRIDDLQLYPDVANHRVKAVVSVNNTTKKSSSLTLDIRVSGKDDLLNYASAKEIMEFGPGVSTLNLWLELAPDAPLWNEFHPYLYEATAILQGNRTTTGIRKWLFLFFKNRREQTEHRTKTGKLFKMARLSGFPEMLQSVIRSRVPVSQKSLVRTDQSGHRTKGKGTPLVQEIWCGI